MTGEKNRFSTHEKLWKLDDDTLSTPAHDDLVIGLLNLDKILKLFPDIEPAYNTLSFKVDERGRELAYYSGDDLFKYCQDILRNIHGSGDWIDGILGTNNIKSVKKIRTDYNRIKYGIKYGDDDSALKDLYNTQLKEIADIVTHDTTTVKTIIKSFKQRLNISKFVRLLSEYPVVSGHNNFIIGYWDLVVKYNREHDLTSGISAVFGEAPEYFIEVKPRINSFGQTLRQIKTYMVYLPYGVKGVPDRKVVLYTPDTRFKDAFESQGIMVVSP